MNAEIHAEDRAILVALYNVTGGDAWSQNTGWCTDAPISEWHGVTVDEEGRVVRLQLRHNNLEGEPKESNPLEKKLTERAKGFPNQCLRSESS